MSSDGDQIIEGTSRETVRQTAVEGTSSDTVRSLMKSLKVRDLVVDALATDKPATYSAWKYALKASIAGVTNDITVNEEYLRLVDATQQHTENKARVLYDIDLRRIDIKVFDGVYKALGGAKGEVLKQSIRDGVRFGAGLEAIYLLDEYFQTDSAKAKGRAVSEFIALKIKGKSANEVERFTVSYRFLQQKSGLDLSSRRLPEGFDDVGETLKAVRREVLVRACKEVPELSGILRVWEQVTIDNDPTELLKLIEKNTAERMFSEKGKDGTIAAVSRSTESHQQHEDVESGQGRQRDDQENKGLDKQTSYQDECRDKQIGFQVEYGDRQISYQDDYSCYNGKGKPKGNSKGMGKGQNSQAQKGYGKGGQKGRSDVICFRCNKPGHMAPACVGPMNCNACGKDGHAARNCKGGKGKKGTGKSYTGVDYPGQDDAGWKQFDEVEDSSAEWER